MTGSADRPAGDVVLVTGSSGSVGRVLVERLGHAGVGELRLVERADAPGQSVRMFPTTIVRSDINDRPRIDPAMRGVSRVIHLAAQKDLEAAEADPWTAVRSNVMGTHTIVEAASSEGVRRLIAASSAKACAPTSTLGLTKAIAERIVVGASGIPERVAVRFPNIVPSGGSVLERWSESVRARGEIEVTDSEMTRFILPLGDAVGLLLRLLFGPPLVGILVPRASAIRLGDLATAFAAQHGARIREVGPRPGEKRHEQLLSAAEAPFARFVDEGLIICSERTHQQVGELNSNQVRRMTASELQTLISEPEAASA